jgi:hypothetical protein
MHQLLIQRKGKIAPVFKITESNIPHKVKFKGRIKDELQRGSVK